MKKITSILTLLLAFVGVTASAQLTDDEKAMSAVTSSTAATSIESDTWYAIYNSGRGGWLSQESDGMYLRSAAPNGENAEEVAGRMFKLGSNGDGTFTIVSGNGLTFQVVNWSGGTSVHEPSADYYFYVGLFPDCTDKFYLVQQDEVVVDANPVGSMIAGWGSGIPTEAGTNNVWQFMPVTLTNALHTVTYNVYLDGSSEVYQSTTATVGEGDPIGEISMDYVDMTSYEPAVGTTVTEDITVTVTATSNLPFTTSTSADAADATWYLVDMHSNYDDYIWKYVADATTNVQLPVVGKSQTTAPTDDYLWCFTGNLVDGFSIYNKATGSTMPLGVEGDSGIASLSNSETATTVFKLVKTSTSIENGHCFLPVDHTNYLNHQGEYLNRWSDNDAGSTCRFFAPSQYLLNYVETISNVPENAIGGYIAETLDALTSAAETATAAPFDLDAAAALASAIAGLSSSDETVADNGYYRLVNLQDGDYLTLYNSDGSYLMHDTEAPKAVTSVFQFVPTETEGTYQIKVEGLTLGQTVQSEAVVASAEGTGLYTVTKASNAGQFLIQDVSEYTDADANYRYLHVNTGNLVGWTDADATRWYIVPATDVEVPLTTIGDYAYAAVYMPFAVAPTGDAALYTGVLSATESPAQLDLTKREAVPAETGVIVVDAADATTATLTISDAVVEIDANSLRGSLLDVTSDVSTYYVLTNADGTPVFNNCQDTEIAANTAFFDGTSYTDAVTVDMFAITGINKIATDVEDNAPIYDLSGRRVVKAVKGGLYIQKGNKFIAK